MEFCNIIVVKNNLVEENLLFVDFDIESVSKKAEGCFKSLCNKEYSRFYKKEMDDDSLQEAIENGYWDNSDYVIEGENEISIQIFWPNVNQKISRPIKVVDMNVRDPDSGDYVDVEIWKDETSGALFGVDTSFLENVRCTGIPSPFNVNEYFDMRDENDYTGTPIFNEDSSENPLDK